MQEPFERMSGGFELVLLCQFKGGLKSIYPLRIAISIFFACLGVHNIINVGLNALDALLIVSGLYIWFSSIRDSYLIDVIYTEDNNNG
jgi:hypothetical protein